MMILVHPGSCFYNVTINIYMCVILTFTDIVYRLKATQSRPTSVDPPYQRFVADTFAFIAFSHAMLEIIEPLCLFRSTKIPNCVVETQNKQLVAACI